MCDGIHMPPAEAAAKFGRVLDVSWKRCCTAVRSALLVIQSAVDYFGALQRQGLNQKFFERAGTKLLVASRFREIIDGKCTADISFED
jgi:hypothetical protein